MSTHDDFRSEEDIKAREKWLCESGRDYGKVDVSTFEGQDEMYIDPQIEELHRWWTETAERDFQMMLPKLRRYGAYDLKIMGAEIAHLTGVVRGVQLSALAEELAIWFYCSGKVARLQAEYEQGLPGDDDHWVDTVIYAMMARRVKAAGGWPWKEAE